MTAIIFGVAFDFIGTSVAGIFIGIIASVVLISRGVRFAEFTTVLYSSMPFLVISLGFGLLLTVMGGFLTAHLAKVLEVEHACLMEAFVMLVGFIFGLMQPQLPGWYSTTSLILTIPAAVLGGYLRRISRKHRSLLI